MCELLPKATVRVRMQFRSGKKNICIVRTHWEQLGSKSFFSILSNCNILHVAVRDTGICTFIKPKPLKGHEGTCVIQPTLRPLRQSASSLIGSSNDLCVCLFRQLTFSKSGPQRLTCEDNCHCLHYVSSVGSCHVSSVSAHFPDMRQKPVSANWGKRQQRQTLVTVVALTHTWDNWSMKIQYRKRGFFFLVIWGFQLRRAKNYNRKLYSLLLAFIGCLMLSQFIHIVPMLWIKTLEYFQHCGGGRSWKYLVSNSQRAEI